MGMMSMQTTAYRALAMGLATCLALGIGVAGTSARAAEKKTVTEEVLEILKASGTISEQKYQELLERARVEEAERAATAELAAEAVEASKPPEGGAVAKDPKGWTVKWSNGTNVERNDGQFKLKFGGRVMLDMAQIWGDGALRSTIAAYNSGNNGTGFGAEFRRARLFVQGTLYDRFLFKVQYEFADIGNGNTVDFKDVYMGLQDMGPLGTIRIGHMKEDFSLEEMASSNYIVFMERALPSVFNPDRNTGISGYNTFLDGRLRYALGGFRETNDGGFGFSTSTPTTYHITGRLTGLPYWEDDGKKLVHLGLDYSHQFTGSGGTDNPPLQPGLRYRKRPEAHLAQPYVDTAAMLDAEAVDLFTAEFAAGANSVWAQAEWQASRVDRARQDDVFFWGIYGQLAWFVTGEHRSYSQPYANFGRTQLLHNFDPEAGHYGALELAARLSYLDLNDHNIRGGRLLDVTAGANWYLWPNVRVMANYIHSFLRSRPAAPGALFKPTAPGQGDGDLFEMRFQFDF